MRSLTKQTRQIIPAFQVGQLASIGDHGTCISQNIILVQFVGDDTSMSVVKLEIRS